MRADEKAWVKGGPPPEGWAEVEGQPGMLQLAEGYEMNEDGKVVRSDALADNYMGVFETAPNDSLGG